MLVDGARAVAAARVGEVAAHRALEKTLTSLARELAVVFARTLVPAHHTLDLLLAVVVVVVLGTAAVRRAVLLLYRRRRRRVRWLRGRNRGWGRLHGFGGPALLYGRRGVGLPRGRVHDRGRRGGVAVDIFADVDGVAPRYNWRLCRRRHGHIERHQRRWMRVKSDL